MENQLPSGYDVARSPTASSRWIVSYKGDPSLFEEKINALGETRIKSFRTKELAIQAAIEHKVMIDRLEADSQKAYKQERTTSMSTPSNEGKEQHTPTPADEAIYATMLTTQALGAIQQAYTDGKIENLETYNKLYEAAEKAHLQVYKLMRRLEKKNMSMEEIMDKEHEEYEKEMSQEDDEETYEQD